LNRHDWTSTNAFTSGMFSRAAFQIGQANEFLRQSTNNLLDERNITGSVRDQIPTLRAEARWIRALSYWHAIDLFGNFPFATDDDVVGQLPPQTSATEIFNFIEQDLLGSLDDLLDPGSAPLGRADRAAAWMLLAKLYLNAEVYTGTDRYTDCIDMCNRIINSGAFNLAQNYNDNFGTDNNLFGEIIFPLIHDGVLTESFGGVSTFVGHGSQGGPDDASGDLGIGGGWAGIRPLQNLFELFPENFSLDARAQFDTTRTDGENIIGRNIRAEALSGGDFGTNGYLFTKITNLSSTGSVGSDGTFLDTDFPMFRLADVHLMLAESVLRGGSGASRATALELVNALRVRAYGDNSGDIIDGELTIDFILDERARELSWEMHRRQDLIRYGRFTTTGIWQFKGGDTDGTTSEGFRDIYPIPSTQISAFGGALIQNPGYN